MGATATLDELVAKAEELSGIMEGLEEVAAGDDEAKATTARAELDAKQKEWEAVTEQVEQAKARQDRAALVAELRLAAKAQPGGDLAVEPEPSRESARAKDRDDRELTKGFYAYMEGKILSDRLHEALRPKSEAFKEGGDGVVMPRRMAAKILGPGWVRAMELTRSEVETEAKALGSDQGYHGGNLVPQEFVPILQRLPGEPVAIFPRCTILPCQTGQLTFPFLEQSDAGGEYGGVTFSWINEGAEKDETEPVFQQRTIDAHELAGYTEITHRLISRSAIAIEPLLVSLYRDALMNIVDTALLTGTGVGQPLGVIPCAGVRVVARAAAGAVAWADLLGLKHALMAYHRSGAIFVLDDTVEAALLNVLDANNRPVFNNNFGEGMYERLAGKPYITLERTPNLGTEGDVVFGDFSKYIIAMEEDIVIKRSDHFRFRHNRAAFVCYIVLGGMPMLPRAFAILSDNS
jgi:HK97 family phage major capsid protein